MKFRIILISLFSAISSPSGATPVGFLPTTLTTSSCYELKSNWMPASSTLVGYWNFNETAGTTTADSSGNAFSGTASGGVAFGVTGKLNKAITLDGTDGIVNIGDRALLRPTSFPFSISFWIKMNAMPASTAPVAIVGSNATGATNVYSGYTIFLKSTGQLVAQLGKNGSACATAGRASTYSPVSVITTGSWQFVTVVFTALTGNAIYINGRPVATTSDGTTATFAYGATNELRLGYYEKPLAGCVTPSSFLSASLDELAFWSGALTAAEVKTMYDQQSCGKN